MILIMFDTEKWKKDIDQSSLELLKIIKKNKTFHCAEQMQQHLELADEHLILILQMFKRYGWGNIFLAKNWQSIKHSYCELKTNIEYFIQLEENVSSGE